MTTHFGTGLLALAATASIAMAHGENGPGTNGGDKKKGDKKGEPISLFDNTTVTYTPGSGITFDGGDDFSLTLSNQFQYKWTYVSAENAANVNTFDIRRARTTLSGHIWDPSIRFMFRNDWEDANGRSTKDFWVHWNFLHNDDSTLGLRLGQTKTHLGRAFTGSSSKRELIELDPATRAFAAVRSRGVSLHGQHLPDDKLHWSVGVFNRTSAPGVATNAGEEAFNDDNELTYLATVRFDPMGDMNGGKGNEAYEQGDLRDADGERNLLMSFGAGVELANAAVVAAGDVEGTTFNVNAALKVAGFHLLSEIYLRSDDPANGASEDSAGFNIQGSYTLPGREGGTRWAPAFRFSQLDVDDTPVIGLTGTSLGATAGEVREISLGINAYYHGHGMKTQLNYTLQQVEPDVGADADNHIIDIMFTLLF